MCALANRGVVNPWRRRSFAPPGGSGVRWTSGLLSHHSDYARRSACLVARAKHRNCPAVSRQNWLPEALEQLEAYYWASGGPAEKSQADMRRLGAGTWQPALAIFYAHYAFERAGAPRSWGPLAGSIVENFPKDANLANLPDLAWNEFTSRVAKPNRKTNPLAVGATKMPATAFVRGLGKDRHNIISWAARMTAHGEASVASAQLRSLQGIGPKISAFFLRDVVTSHGIAESALGGREFILPIDVWLRRGIAELVGRPDLVNESRDAQTSDAAIAWADSHELRIATLDAGLWVLGARFARSVPRMIAALKDRSAFEMLVREELLQAEASVAALRRLEETVRAG
jgi:hypothetical protein